MAWPDRVVKGNINSATLTKVKIDGKDKLKVLLRTDNLATSAFMIRERIPPKIQQTPPAGFGAR